MLLLPPLQHAYITQDRSVTYIYFYLTPMLAHTRALTLKACMLFHLNTTTYIGQPAAVLNARRNTNYVGLWTLRVLTGICVCFCVSLWCACDRACVRACERVIALLIWCARSTQTYTHMHKRVSTTGAYLSGRVLCFVRRFLVEPHNAPPSFEQGGTQHTHTHTNSAHICSIITLDFNIIVTLQLSG